MWEPVVARQISKWYSSSCHVFISITDLGGLLENNSRTRSTVSSVTCCLGCFPDTVITVLYLNDIQAIAHWSSWAYNTSNANKHVARAWIPFRYLSSYNWCPHWSVRTFVKIFLSYSVHCWKHKFRKAFRY